MDFDAEEVDKALATAKERGWLLKPEELAQRVARRLREKGKGVHFIQSYLQRLGLPNVEKDPEIEEKRARDLVERKFRPQGKLSHQDQQRVFRFLKSRGFDYETIRKVLYERFGSSEEFC